MLERGYSIFCDDCLRRWERGGLPGPDSEDELD